GGKPWTTTSAPNTTGPPPLRASNLDASRGVASAAVTEAQKGKKKATKRTPTSTGRRKTDEAPSVERPRYGNELFDLTTFMASFEPGRGVASATAELFTAEEPRALPMSATSSAPADVTSELVLFARR
ncbi:hypothetical protein JG687_00019116, partial [Phytophthora cactorum]